MHPFPPAADLDFLVGERLAQIRLNPFTLDFMFEAGSGIQSGYVVEYVAPDGVVSRHDVQEGLAPDPIVFHRSIGRTIAAIEATDARLTLVFDDGAALCVHTDAGPYECGTIYGRMKDGKQNAPLVF